LAGAGVCVTDFGRDRSTVWAGSRDSILEGGTCGHDERGLGKGSAGKAGKRPEKGRISRQSQTHGLSPRAQGVRITGYALALLQAKLDGRAEMYAAKQARHSRLIGRCPEARKVTRFNTIAFTRLVVEREILAKDFEVVLGSASAIFATGIRKLGHEVTFVSQVGRDQFGDFCVDALRAAGISTKQVSRRRNLKTGVTISLSGARDRALVTYPGAIATFSAEQVPANSFQNGQHLHMTSYFLQTALKPSFAEIFRQARKRGLTTSFDPNSDPSRQIRPGGS